MNKVAIVVQRCHPSVIGGSESHAWQYASLLKDTYQIEVLTTTAIDTDSWANVLPEGIERNSGISIRRFKVSQGRTSYWHALHERLLKHFRNKIEAGENPNRCQKKIHWTLALQEEFIRKQGPYSEDLIAFISERSHEYKAVIFLTYLFPTTYFGIRPCSKEHSLLVPTLHDEPAAYLSAYRYMVKEVKSLLWNTRAEMHFGSLLWGDLPGRIVGMGINTHEYEPAYRQYSYLLYCGRIDSYKGCNQLVEYFLRYKKDNPSGLKIILTGKDEIGLTTGTDIIMEGFVSEKEKFQLMSGAFLFVMPSFYESLSIVTLEAMAQNTPVLVNGGSKVLVDHVLQSGGGIIYNDYQSFKMSLTSLLLNRKQRDEMGARGRRYVVSKYKFDAVKRKLIEEIEACG